MTHPSDITALQRPWTGKVLAESPDKCWVAVAGPEHSVQIWQVQQGRLWTTYFGHRAGVYNRRTATIEEAIWVDNERIVSRSQDGSIHLWNARSGIHLRTFVEAGQTVPRDWSSVRQVAAHVAREEELAAENRW